MIFCWNHGGHWLIWQRPYYIWVFWSAVCEDLAFTVLVYWGRGGCCGSRNTYPLLPRPPPQSWGLWSWRCSCLAPRPQSAGGPCVFSGHARAIMPNLSPTSWKYNPPPKWLLLETVLSLLSWDWRQPDKVRWWRIKKHYFLNTIFCYQSLFNRHSIKMLIAAATRERGYCNTNWLVGGWVLLSAA